MKILEKLFPFVIILLILSMLIPLPAWALDILLGANLLLALLLFMLALNIHNPLRLSSLPTILLIATLFRLVLNVSTTRLILSNEEGSAMIEKLGELVMQNNLVVGAVIFAIVTLIQFIVIAKGSERVAEVSARFTLDALPGKQMSIDADIRSGMLDFEGAKKKREELQLESRFYGALDGAMKFVKGDAIAGLLITLINIVGGILIGVLFSDMSVAEAGNHFTRLTVGDGLLSQVPALLNSLAAGLIVTRVVSCEDSSVTGEMLSQLSELSFARISLGVVSFALACFDGMPPIPFIVCGILLIGSVLIQKLREEQPEAAPYEPFEPQLAAPVLLEFSHGALEQVENTSELEAAIEGVRSKLFEKLGLVVLAPETRLLESEEKVVKVYLRGIQSLSLEADEKLCENLGERLELLLRDQRVFLLDDAHTRRILNSLEKRQPELVSSVIPERLRLTDLTWILKRLLEEDVSIGNIDLIMQAIAEAAPELLREQLLEHVRIALAPIVSASRCAEDGQIRVASFEQSFEFAVWEASKGEREDGEALLSSILDQLSLIELEGSEAPALLVNLPIRRFLFEFLQSQGVSMAVIGRRELLASYELVQVARLSTEQNEDIRRVA